MSNTKNCPFCNYQGPSPILYKDEVVYIIEPLHPVTRGHQLVIPHEHIRDATADPYTAAFCVLVAARHLKGPGNIIISVGKEASQTVQHLHVHIVPRRKNDGLKLPWSDREGQL